MNIGMRLRLLLLVLGLGDVPTFGLRWRANSFPSAKERGISASSSGNPLRHPRTTHYALRTLFLTCCSDLRSCALEHAPLELSSPGPGPAATTEADGLSGERRRSHSVGVLARGGVHHRTETTVGVDGLT